MKVIERVEVPKLPPDGKPRLITVAGDYLGHREPCDNPDHFKVRYSAVGHDVIRTFEREKC